MQEIITGHLYRLQNLKSKGFTDLPFYMDPKLHNGDKQDGPSTQEVLRACIARVKALDEERPHPMNNEIITKLREAIILFEARALMNNAGELAIEKWPVGSDGHFTHPVS